MIKKIAIAFLSTTLLSSIALADQDKVVATYDSESVMESQIIQQFKPALEMQQETKGKKFSELDSNLQENLVQAYVRSKLIEKEAKKSGIESSKEFQDRMNDIRIQELQKEFMDRYIKSKVTDKAIDAEYKKLADSLKGQQEAKVSHILVDDQKTADEVKKKLSQGKSFADMVKEYSKDDASKVSNGEIGYVVKGQLVPEFEDKALSMKVGEVSDPIKTDFGWHIIKVLDKRPATVPTKDQALANIKAGLTKDAVMAYIAELEKAANFKSLLTKKEESKADTTTRK